MTESGQLYAAADLAPEGRPKLFNELLYFQ